MTLDFAAVLNGTKARVFDGDGHAVPLAAADLERSIGQVRIDSRQIRPGDLFVALPGEKTDGHNFARDAADRGASAVLAERVTDAPIPHFLVPDALVALQNLARFWRDRYDVPVIGITGSIGKTTTKELTAEILGRDALRTEGNLNTEFGVPLTLLNLESRHTAAVIEMGMYVPGDIALLAGIARPKVGVVTNVAPIHLERVGSIERIARGKSELIHALPPDGKAILNADNPWTRAMAISSGTAPALLFGAATDADFCAGDIVSHGLDGVSFAVAAEGDRHHFRTTVPGKHTVPAFLAAIAVARHLGREWPEIIDAVAAAQLGNRQRIIHIGNSLIIDDSYNAAPMSMNAALELLHAAPGRKIAILGDMLELGKEEETAHRQVGTFVAGVAEWLILRGTRCRWIAEEAARAGMPLDRIVSTENNEKAIQAVRSIVDDESAWALLVKGSRDMQLTDLVPALEAIL